MRQGHPLVVIEKKLGEPTEVIVTYRKELSPRSKSDSRIFTLLSYSKRQEIFAFRLNMKHMNFQALWMIWCNRQKLLLAQILECCPCLLVSEPPPHVCTLKQLDIVIWVVQWVHEGFEFEVHWGTKWKEQRKIVLLNQVWLLAVQRSMLERGKGW